MAEVSTFNYKGVMLCQRPSSDTLNTYTHSHTSSHKPAFKTGSTLLQSNDIGLQPSNTYKLYINKKFRRDKTNNITYKHKQWLKRYSKQIVDKLQTTQPLNKTVKVVSSDELKQQYSKTQNTDTEEKTNDDSSEKENSSDSDTVQHTDNAANKPVWAMTATEAEQAEEEEAEQLLKYTENLDFKAYINDIEVHNALKFVHDRIAQLEQQQADIIKKQRQIDTGDRPVNMNDTDIFGTDNTEYNAITEQLQIERNKQQQLQNQLNSEQTNKLRNIHSNASIRALIEQSKTDNTQTIDNSSVHTTRITDTILPSALTPQPVIAIHNAQQAIATKKTTVDPSNLPYLYRHPGI